MGGSSNTEGRVEIFHRGAWGTVCDNSFDSADSAVVCSFLGFTGANEAVGSAYFGQGHGDILLDRVACSGTESSLSQCGHSGWYSHSCVHAQDVGVRCSLDDYNGKFRRYDNLTKLYY